MRRILMTLPVLAALSLPPVPASAQIGLGFGYNSGIFLDNRFDDIRIGAIARKAIEEYLTGEYKRLCAGKKSLPAGCEEQRPFYQSSFLRAPSTRLPDSVMQKIGFTYPGTTYRQSGFSVYLVRLPDHRIYDVVSIWSNGWK